MLLGWRSILLIVAMLGCPPSEAPAQSVGEIQIRQGATGADFLCWNPIPARVRLSAPTPADVDVTMTSAPLGAEAGDVHFAAAGAAPISRASFSPVRQLRLTLPKDASWVEFYVAGRRASRGTKDVFVRVETAGGALAQLPVMVRVRKDAETLSPIERDAFLRALAAWKLKPGLSRPTRFEDYYTAHDDAFQFGIHSMFGSRVSNFLPWHRAFLLNFERELQQIDPTVTLPYWRFDAAAPRLFSETFIGGLQPPSTEVRFAPTNPIRNWTLRSGETLRRSRGWSEQAAVDPDNFATLLCDAQDPACTTSGSGPFRLVTDYVEANYHNDAHAQVGGWLGRGSSPSDPLFFLLHANVDRGWAHWQERRGRYDGSGQDARAYAPQGRYPGPAVSRREREGLYALDAMWPWGPKVGDGGTPGDPNDDWLPYRFPFPASAGLPFGPTEPPTPAAMIDYLNVGARASGHGACYDDVDFLGRDPRAN